MQGERYDKTVGDAGPLPTWSAAREQLPAPLLDGEEGAMRAYWRAWELVIRNLRRPTLANGFVSNHMFMEFNQCIFAHDTAMMILFGRYGQRLFDAVQSLDNFYVKQHETGEICREIDVNTGADKWPNRDGDPMRINIVEPWGQPADEEPPHYFWTRPTVDTHPTSRCSLEGLNDPSCMAWAEMESYAQTGDLERIRRVLPVQQAWFDAFNTYVRDHNGFYVTDWASVDNHPRNPYLGYGLDVACQVAHLARLLARMCHLADDEAAAQSHAREAEAVSQRIREHMWDPGTGFFYDLDRNGERLPIRSIFGFYPLLAGAATCEQAAQLARHLQDPATFNRPVRIPTLADTESRYTPLGSYIRGGVSVYKYGRSFSHGCVCVDRKHVIHAYGRTEFGRVQRSHINFFATRTGEPRDVQCVGSTRGG